MMMLHASANLDMGCIVGHLQGSLHSWHHLEPLHLLPEAALHVEHSYFLTKGAQGNEPEHGQCSLGFLALSSAPLLMRS